MLHLRLPLQSLLLRRLSVTKLPEGATDDMKQSSDHAIKQSSSIKQASIKLSKEPIKQVSKQQSITFTSIYIHSYHILFVQIRASCNVNLCE